MYKIIFSLTLFTLVSCANPGKENTNTENESEAVEPVNEDGVIIPLQSRQDTLKGSLKAYAESQINGTNIKIHYYSPAVRGRIVWGGLVPYDKVWVTGAHKATNILFDNDILIGDSLVAAGEYAFFTIPGKEKWTVVINENFNQHLTDDYDAGKDVLRLTVTPQVSETPQERLRYFIHTKGDNFGTISMQWDNLFIELSIKATTQ